MNDEVCFEPWNFGFGEIACPACGTVSEQLGGLFCFCPDCGLTCGGDKGNLFDLLVRLSLRENRGGGLA